MARTLIRDLRCDAIHCESIHFDWSEGYGETWDYVEASRCQECGKAVCGREGDRHCDVDHESECRGSIGGEGPMMNYYYPVEISDTEAAALALADTCLCVVTVNGTTGLALTGGGMNLAWEICEAFMLLGHAPPLHFCDLPGMAGRGISKRDRWIVGGCLKSCRVAANWARGTGQRLRETVKRERERSAKRKEVA